MMNASFVERADVVGDPNLHEHSKFLSPQARMMLAAMIDSVRSNREQALTVLDRGIDQSVDATLKRRSTQLRRRLFDDAGLAEDAELSNRGGSIDDWSEDPGLVAFLPALACRPAGPPMVPGLAEASGLSIESRVRPPDLATRLDRWAERIRTNAPVIGLSIAASGLALLASFWIIPEFEAMFDEFELDLPPVTRWVLAVAAGVRAMVYRWPWVAAGGAAIGLITHYALRPISRLLFGENHWDDLQTATWLASMSEFARYREDLGSPQGDHGGSAHGGSADATTFDASDHALWDQVLLWAISKPYQRSRISDAGRHPTGSLSRGRIPAAWATVWQSRSVGMSDKANDDGLMRFDYQTPWAMAQLISDRSVHRRRMGTWFNLRGLIVGCVWLGVGITIVGLLAPLLSLIRGLSG